MAKTIEQRADEFAEREYINDQYEKERISFGYYHGATEQRKIDVDKACEVYRKELVSIIDIFNRFGKELYNINEFGEFIHLEGSVKDFRKAIEDEQ